MPQKSKEEYFNSEMEDFESLRNGINNPPLTMSQQSKASDTTADTNDMANLRQVIPGSQQPLSQLSERSESDDINAMFSQQSNDSEQFNQEDRNARRSRWAEKEERSAAAESNNPIEKMRAAAWSKVEDTPINNNNTTNNNNNSTPPSWADRISGVTTDVLVGTNNTNTTTTKSGDLGDLAKSPSQKKNIQNVNDKMSSLLGNNNSPTTSNKEDGEGILSPTNWGPINSSEEQSTTTTTGHIPPRWGGQSGRLYDNSTSSSRVGGDEEAWMNDIINSATYDPIDPSSRLSMFDNDNSSESSGLPGESPEGDNLVSAEKGGGGDTLYLFFLYPD